MVQSCEKGIACCRNTWTTECGERYECPFGFQDFSIPIVLPDGRFWARCSQGRHCPTRRRTSIFCKKRRGLDSTKRPSGTFLPAYPEKQRRNCTENGYKGSFEYPVIYPGDTEYEWHEINVFVNTEEDGSRVANILGRDVTEAHERADTKAQLEIANASNAAKSAFLFNMSHDIRTPMNAIIGFTELLEKHIDDRELALSYLGKIRTSNDFLLSLINNVLEMARIESGKATLDETYRDAHKFNDTLFSMFDSQMKEKGIEFTRENHVIHKDMLFDETKLREIFLNILSNSLKYTPPAGRCP